MTIKKVPLNDTDKRLLKRALKIRIIIGIIFFPAFLIVMGMIPYSIIHDLLNGSYDGMTFFGIALTLIIIFLLYKFVIPFYKKSFKNMRVKDKIVVTTRIKEIKDEFINGLPRYTVYTDYMVIRSWAVSVLQPKLKYPDMYVNMMIELHLLENNQVDILYLGRA